MRGCTVLALNENYVQVIVLPTIFPLQIHVSACRSDVQRGHTRAATRIRRVGDENQPADEKQHHLAFQRFVIISETRISKTTLGICTDSFLENWAAVEQNYHVLHPCP
jgi:hypothetical protein